MKKRLNTITQLSQDIEDEDEDEDVTNNHQAKTISFKQQSSIFSSNQLPLLNGMTKSYNFNINNALEYTCNRETETEGKFYDFCGNCNSCQIIKYQNNLKQWFNRASHITLRKFLIGLVVRINNVKIYRYLNDLLKPLSESKDFMYARNKFLPSCDEDHLKPANNRCLDDDYINRQINFIWNWYSNSSNFIKQNFILSVLIKCEQVLVFQIISQLKSILETANATLKDMNKVEEKVNFDEFRIRDFKKEEEILNDSFDSIEDVNYSSDNELVCEAYDEDDDDDDDPLVRADEEVKSILNQPNQKSFHSKNSKYVDFIRQLPVHLSKFIINHLDIKSLSKSLLVCKYWSIIVKEVKKEEFLQKLFQDDLLVLKGTTTKTGNPKFANNVDVKVPNLYPGTYECKKNDSENEIVAQFKADCTWENAYTGYQVRNVIMEERNVFCGAYNVFVLKEKRDPYRVAHMNGQKNVIYSELNKTVNLVDIKTNSESDSHIQGHAGTIKAIYVCESRGLVVTGSYDTSVRCWSLETGKCLCIFQGHQQTVTCLSMYDPYERIISGCNDNTCKIWNYGKKKCWRTFKHSYAVVSVAISDEFCVTGGITGKLKLFHLLSGQLVKTISAHQGRINALKFDKWHILTASVDGYSLAFSTQGKHKKCLIAMRHPKEVSSIEFLFMRSITGCADGKVRIWNILTGDCIRMIRGNSRSDPILSISLAGQRILLNTENSVLLLEFEKVVFEYNVENIIETGFQDQFDKSKFNQKIEHKRKSYSAVRASRMELASVPNSRLFNDNRKTIIDHSARPISGKILVDARKIYSAVSRSNRNGSEGIITNRINSAGHISENALIKRRSIMESINAIISSQGSRLDSTLSNYKGDDLKVGFVTQADSNRSDDDPMAISKVKRTPANLNETKQYLRDQLREIKEAGQLTDSASKELDTKSANIPVNSNRYTSVFKKNFIRSETIRPTSSPSRVNTKKIKLKAHQFMNRLDGKIPLNDGEDSDEDPIFRTTKRSHIYVSKKFESQETALKTNANMHPINIKSKIPNPKLIRPQTSPSKRVEQLPSTFIGAFFINESEQVQSRVVSTNINRSKSAIPPSSVSQISAGLGPSSNSITVPILKQRPKTTANPLRVDLLKKASIIDLKLGINDNDLNLRTFREVDKIVDVINGQFNTVADTSPDWEKDREKDKADIYKKFWHLKSTGHYHGSLLAKPRILAPEIRE